MANIPPFTSNERLDNAQLGDNTYEVTGVILELDPRPVRANAPAPRVPLFRCILNNTQGRRIRVLFWEENAATYETQVYGQVITITRARIVPSDARFPGPLGLMKIEISVQRRSTVTIHGPYANPDGGIVLQIPEVPLANIGEAEGIVRIVGYISTAFETQEYGNSSYGSGAITDGYYRMVINVSIFNVQNAPAIGTHVRLQGTLRRNNFQTLLLQVQDMTNIHIVDEQIMLPEHLNEGFRIPPGVVSAHVNPGAVAGRPAVVQAANPIAGAVAREPAVAQAAHFIPGARPVIQAAVQQVHPIAGAVPVIPAAVHPVIPIAGAVPVIPAAVDPVIPMAGAVPVIPAAVRQVVPFARPVANVQIEAQPAHPIPGGVPVVPAAQQIVPVLAVGSNDDLQANGHHQVPVPANGECHEAVDASGIHDDLAQASRKKRQRDSQVEDEIVGRARRRVGQKNKGDVIVIADNSDDSDSD